MLSSLSIKNIALIENLTINLKEGLNVLTGETGAGKSLIIDSISLLLGERADKNLISTGKDFAYVEAVFEDLDSCVGEILESFGLEREDTIVISRKITAEGKNECRVNGKVFTLSMLKKLTAPLMDLHGQFEHQSLLKPSNHIKVLDDFNKDKIYPLMQEFQSILYELKDIKSELSSFEVDLAERERLIEIYGYQINEIESANFKIGEEEELKEFRVRVLSQEKILSSIKRALELSLGGGYGGASISEMIGKISAEISSISPYLKEVENLSSRLDGVKYEIIDIIDNLESIKDNLYFNEFEAEENEKRLDMLSSMKKKYGATIEDINEYLLKIKQEYKKLESSEEIINELLERKEKLESRLGYIGGELTKVRQEVAVEFEKKMIEELISLGMKDASFKVNFIQRSIEEAQNDGLDKIEFLFTANAGQPLKPLSSVASGGEMSRLMLSIKNISGSEASAGTMIFDEIDTGVSGYIAGVIAEKLLSISKNHQVICVTHLAQIASFGNTHFYIEKHTVDGKTATAVREINDDDRIKEVARLIGGKITDHSLNHAKEMIVDGINFFRKL